MSRSSLFIFSPFISIRCCFFLERAKPSLVHSYSSIESLSAFFLVVYLPGTEMPLPF